MEHPGHGHSAGLGRSACLGNISGLMLMSQIVDSAILVILQMKTRADLKKKILLCNGMRHSRHGHSASLGNISG
jgi:hypothetical protein